VGEPQGRSGNVRKITPLSGFDPGPSSPYRVAILTELPRPTVVVVVEEEEEVVLVVVVVVVVAAAVAVAVTDQIINT
jgi:hypothetical protein